MFVMLFNETDLRSCWKLVIGMNKYPLLDDHNYGKPAFVLQKLTINGHVPQPFGKLPEGQRVSMSKSHFGSCFVPFQRWFIMF